MKKRATIWTIGYDLFRLQLSWTFWALGIFILINILRIAFMDEADTFYNNSFIASNIYMLVIGIISIYFLMYFVELGVTRKNYFFGNMLASLGLSIAIPILAYLISLVEKFAVSVLTSIELREENLEALIVDVDGNLIGEIIQSIILTPFVHPDTNLVISLAVFSLNILLFYLAGWLIGAAFNRLGVVGGIIIVIVSIVLISLKDSMLRIALDYPLLENFSFFGRVPEAWALPLLFAVVLVMFGLIRLITKRAPIKI